MKDATNKEIISTLDVGVPILDERRCGNTTRLVDAAIQILFSGNICEVRDHVDNGKHYDANLYLFNAIMRRLSVEHAWSIKNSGVIASKQKLQIQLSAQRNFFPKVELGTGVTLNNI